ncbi:plasmid stabilization protein ParE [Sphingomonas sp. HMWF008]|nr:plasmid stabilization protein ParE [Sphingomonas sp. HMWF008]
MHRLSKQARIDARAIYTRSAELFGTHQADAYAEGLNRTFRFLADHPRAARERVEIRPPIRAFAYKSHLILYVIEGQDILILRIRHAHEDWLSNPV